MKKDVLRGRSIVRKNVFDVACQSIEQIKKNNPIVQYFRDHGVKLTKVGNDEYKGLCPFHNDTHPSLFINDLKQVFNCFGGGCGKKGTVIDACAYFENVSSGEAVKILQGLATGSQRAQREDTEKKGKGEKEKSKSKEVFDMPLQHGKEKAVEGEETQCLASVRHEKEKEEKKEENCQGKINKGLLLDEVVKKYCGCFFGNKNALDYLKSRGFSDLALMGRFKVGFCDGKSLLSLLGKTQREGLREIGILNKNGYEVFNNCLIFPIVDNFNRIVGVYGRNIDDKSKFKHLYLPGNHRSVFNRRASKVYDEVILTEGIIDALSLVQLGINNVQACYGVNGFTDEMLEILKEDNVKTVIIGFDNDNAGKKGAEKLKERLINENFIVKMIYPSVKPVPSGVEVKDWNEALIKGINKEEVEKLITTAEVFKKEEIKKDFIHKLENNQHIFIIGDITYRLAGVKDVFVTNLKVTITAEMGDFYFPDTVDLCVYRSRISFSNHLAGKFNVEPQRVENDLLKILRFLETERDNRLNPEEKGKIELTEEEVKLGMDFLKSSNIFDQIVDDMALLGYTGERINKILIYLCATSRLMIDPFAILVVAQSSAGKSYLIETIGRFMPPEAVVDGQTFSKQALQYMGKKLMDKFFIMGEAILDPEIEYQLRELLSAHKLTRQVVIKDETTGEMTTKEVTVEAKMSSAMSTTNNRINQENATRYFIINTDETKKQSLNIVKEHKTVFNAGKILDRQESVPHIIKKHHSGQRMLKKILITMPDKMLDNIHFPVATLRCRRDSKRFLNLIASVCFLRQYQKEVQQLNNGARYIECDAFDYSVAYEIVMSGIMAVSLSDLAITAKELHEIMRDIIREASDKKGLKFNETCITQRIIREKTGYSQTWVKTNLKILVDYEYVCIARGGSEKTKGYYYINEDDPIEKTDIKKTIPTPEQMKEILN